MEEIALKKPTLEEMYFREKLLSDPETMSYNHAYGGTINFPKEQWEEWYAYWMENVQGKRFYRYLYNKILEEYIGEVYYRYDEKMDTYCCGILILDKWRNKGYGTEGIRLLCRSAKENGIKEFYDNIAIDNPSVNLFKKLGFTEKFRNEEYIRVYKKL